MREREEPLSILAPAQKKLAPTTLISECKMLFILLAGELTSKLQKKLYSPKLNKHVKVVVVVVVVHKLED